MNLELDAFTNALLVIVITFFVIVLFVGVTTKINEFSHELKYLNIEIGRNEGAEREYWKRKARSR